MIKIGSAVRSITVVVNSWCVLGTNTLRIGGWICTLLTAEAIFNTLLSQLTEPFTTVSSSSSFFSGFSELSV